MSNDAPRNPSSPSKPTNADGSDKIEELPPKEARPTQADSVKGGAAPVDGGIVR